jgi:hypothetical protein
MEELSQALPGPVDFTEQVLVRSYPDEEQQRVVVSIASLCLQTHTGKGMAQLLELSRSFGLVCTVVNFCHFLVSSHAAYPFSRSGS